MAGSWMEAGGELDGSQWRAVGKEKELIGHWSVAGGRHLFLGFF